MKMKWITASIAVLLFALTVSCSNQEEISASADVHQKASSLAKGVDVSWLTQMESSGIKFYNNSGTQPNNIFNLHVNSHWSIVAFTPLTR